MDKIKFFDNHKLINYFAIPLDDSQINGYLVFNFSPNNKEDELKNRVLKYETELKAYLKFKKGLSYLDQIVEYERGIEYIRQEFLEQDSVLVRYMGTSY